MIALVTITATIIIFALAAIALYAISRWKYWQDKYNNLTKLGLLCLFVPVLFGSCSTSESFTTTRTKLNFYEYPDTLHWEVRGDNIILKDHGRTISIDNKDGIYKIDSCRVFYKIDGANVWVEHW